MKSIVRIFFVALVCMFLPMAANAQLQQSGGGGSALNSITLGGNAVTALATGELNINLARVAGNTIAVGNGTVSSTGSPRVAIGSDNTPFTVKTVPSNGCGTTAFSQAWAAVPTSNTSVTGTTTCKAVIVLTNTNATAQTVTVTDGQGSPITAIGPAFSIPGLSTVRFEMEGQLTTGFKWQAGGTGITGSAVGYQ